MGEYTTHTRMPIGEKAAHLQSAKAAKKEAMLAAETEIKNDRAAR
jgi:hypothetical protein